MYQCCVTMLRDLGALGQSEENNQTTRKHTCGDTQAEMSKLGATTVDKVKHGGVMTDRKRVEKGQVGVEESPLDTIQFL
jgi:hypothetical protein